MATSVALASDTLHIRDFSDRELLYSMLDESRDGIVGSRRLAIRIFGLEESEENENIIRYYTRCVSSRFAWMRRYGMVERGETQGTWVISATGAALLAASLPRALEQRLDDIEDERALALANKVGLKLVSASDVASTAMRRELSFQIERRKKGAR